MNGLQRIGVSASHAEDCSVEVVAFAETEGCVDGAGEVRPYGQRHRGGAVAAIDVEVVVDERIDSRLGEERVEAGRLETDTRADVVRERHSAGRVHRDVQHDGAVAAIDGGDDARVGGVTHFVGGHVEAVQAIGLALAEGGVEVGGVQLVHDEVEHGGAVAAVHGSGVLLVVAGHSGILDVEAVLRVGVAVADVRLQRVAVFGTHGQVERHDAVATIDGL